MSSSRPTPGRRTSGQPGLFDLELGPEERAHPEEAGASSFEAGPRPPGAEPPGPVELGEEPASELERIPAPFSTRAFAGLTDLVVHLAVLALLLGGVRALGIVPAAADLPALLALILIFSLFYTVIPLAFWGRTPGMAAAGLESRSLGGEPLSFGQAARRWMASLLVLISAGILGLAALGGTSLADRMSGSRTYLE